MPVFLSKSDSRKMLLLHTIEKNIQQQITISELKRKMNISDFVIQNIYGELKEDIKNYNLTKFIVIKKSNNEIILQKRMDFSIQILQNIYVHSSLSFQIIEDIFKGNFVNPSYYAKQFYISRTKVYTQINAIKEHLQKYDLTLSVQFNLLGDELSIRMYIYNLYLATYSGTKSRFSKNSNKNIDYFITILEDTFLVTLSKSSLSKLRIFLGISLIRIKNSYGLKTKISSTDNSPELTTMQKSISELASNAFNQKLNDIESDVLTHFILNLTEFKCSYEKIIKEEKLDYLTIFFLAEFEFYFGKKIEPQLKKTLSTHLMKLHSMLLNFKILQNDLQTTIDSQFLSDNYPEIVDFCQHLFMVSSNKKNLNLIQKNNTYLFSQYALLLINVLPTALSNKVITVCVDFSLGENYNKFITKSIITFDCVTIRITHQMTPSVNILLCDYFSKEEITKNIHVIIWNTPPTTKDWQDFMDCISAIRMTDRATNNDLKMISHDR